MDRLGAKLIAALIVQVGVPGLYVFSGVAEQGGDSWVVHAIEAVSTPVGELIPKAIWHSRFFASQGMTGLAVALVRVHGLALIVFLSCLAIYFAHKVLFEGSKLAPARQDEMTAAARDRLVLIRRMAIAMGIIAAYYSLIGFGLLPPGESDLETSNGSGVLVAPVLSWSLLLLVIIYVAERWSLPKDR